MSRPTYTVKSIRYTRKDWLLIAEEMHAEGYNEYSKWIKKLITERREHRERLLKARNAWAKHVNPISEALNLPQLPFVIQQAKTTPEIEPVHTQNE